MAADSARGGRAEDAFRAMGCSAHVIVTAAEDETAAALLAAARRRIEHLESLWSRFRSASEVSRLNAHSGHPVTVSWETVLLVRRAIEAWRRTGGGFDPSVLAAMVAAGYDRDFAELDLSRPGVWVPAPPSIRHAACTDIEIDGMTVVIPEGLGFDPGGIGKGLAADLVATEAITAGAFGVCVNLGGDVRAIGDPAPGEDPGRRWRVDVDAPGHDRPVAHLQVADGAVATSTTLLRRWWRGGRMEHHLIDPSTGRPSTSDVVLVSVTGPEAWAAETLAKASLLRGSSRVFDLLDASSWALALTADGRVLTTQDTT